MERKVMEKPFKHFVIQLVENLPEYVSRTVLKGFFKLFVD